MSAFASHHHAVVQSYINTKLQPGNLLTGHSPFLKLGIRDNSSQAEVEKRHKELVLWFHPDKSFSRFETYLQDNGHEWSWEAC